MTNENDDYKVGFGRPPLHSRFRKGESGNPKGREKGQKNVRTLVKEEMFRPVDIRDTSGRTVRVPLIQAVLRSLGARSVKETRAAVVALGLLERTEVTEATPDVIEMRDLLAEDKEILARYGLSMQSKGSADENDG